MHTNHRRHFVATYYGGKRRMVWHRERIDKELDIVVQSKHVGNDFTNGHRGEAHAHKGAKKFISTRHRAKAKEKIQELLNQEEV